MVFLMPTTGRFIRSTGLIASLTLISRLFGLVRECTFATLFSTGEILSAFRIAFMIPNLARRLFGEGALSAAMIPVLTQSLQSQGEEASRQFVGSLMKVLITVLIIGVVAIELILMIWRTTHDDLALKLSAILMPYMAMICVVAIAGGVLQVRGHFSTPAIAPALLNLTIIMAAWIGAKWFDLNGLYLMYMICGGVLIGGLTQLCLTALALKLVSFFPDFSRPWRDPQIKSVSTLMGPMILGLSAVQINSLMDYLIAYFFVVENGERIGPAVLGYAQYLYQLPLGVFGIALATAIFPVLAEKAAQQDRTGLAEILDRGLRMSLFIALPASVGLMFVAHPLIATLYQRGEFDASDTNRVAGVLIFYSLGLAAYFTQHIIVRAFYALKDSKSPAKIALCMVGINLILNLVLVSYLDERGLALATAVCAIIQVLWLRKRIKKIIPELQQLNATRSILKMIAATVIMAGVLYAFTLPIDIFESIRQYKLLHLILMVVSGAITYAVASRLLCIEELKSILSLRRQS